MNPKCIGIAAGAALAAMVSATGAFAQQHVADPDPGSPSNAWHFYQNQGQIVDESGNVRPEIRYYTDRTFPAAWFGDHAVSFGAVGKGDRTVPDTSYRIDMAFACELSEWGPCGNLQAYEQTSEHLNYYLPHCSSGIEDVRGHAGLVYQNAFRQTDVHFYSNNTGPVTYFVFNPGSDTGAFALRFAGQDSITAVANFLEVHLGPTGLILPFATAYQDDGFGNVIPLPWTPVWKDAGNGVVRMGFGPYNPAQKLIIRTGGKVAATTAAPDNLIWSTYYGSASIENSPLVASESGTTYHVMATEHVDFPLVEGASFGLQSRNNGKFDLLLTCFDANFRQVWATYHGGKDDDIPEALLALDAEIVRTYGAIILGGLTFSDDLPLGPRTPAFKKTSKGLAGDGFITGFSHSTGRLEYATYYGGSGSDNITALNYDPVNDEVYFGGRTTSTSVDATSANPAAAALPLRNKSGAYYQSSLSGSTCGIVGKFSGATRDLIWATLLGQSATTQNTFASVHSIAHDHTGGRSGLYAVLETSSGPSGSVATTPRTVPPGSGVPMVDPGGSTRYLQESFNGYGASSSFICHFNNSGAIDWGTLFAGGGSEIIRKAVVAPGGDLYVAATTIGSTPRLTNSPLAPAKFAPVQLPIYHIGAAYTQGPGNTSTTGPNTHRDAILARFSPAHDLTWCSFFGGNGHDAADMGTLSGRYFSRPNVDIVVDNSNTVHVASYGYLPSSGSPVPMSVVNIPGRYNQSNHAFSSSNAVSNAVDGWVAQFRPNNSLKWSTHFGGIVPGTASWNTDPNAMEQINSVAVVNKWNGAHGLLMTGITQNANIPTTGRCPGSSSYCDQSYDGKQDVFIGYFENANATSIDEMSAGGDNDLILVHPNPSSGAFQVNFVNIEHSVTKAKVSVMNALGQRLSESEIQLTWGQNPFSVDLSAYPAGLYLLHIEAGGRVAAARLLKQ